MRMPAPPARALSDEDADAPRRPPARYAMLVASAVLSTLLAGAGAVAAEGVFVDRAVESGLVFTHFNGMSGEHYFPEMTGQGGALLDYDGDGDLDVYLVQGTMLGAGRTLADALLPPGVDTPLEGDRLFRNDLWWDAAGAPRLRFVDVTETSGLDADGYGMGAAVGDLDSDGDPDLYVTNFGANQLWINRGDGTFEDATEASGTGDELWGTSAAFVDYDGDGRLDLYVANYVEFDLERNPACYATSSRRDYCGPAAFEPQPDRLYRNLGGGRFEDVTLRALVGYRPGPGLGVTAADFDRNGRLDLYVANDGEVNQLWLNRGDGTFTDMALLSGAALNRAGQAEASMGVDVADFDGDGDDDLFMAHLMGETNTLYVNDGSALFEDRTTESGLGGPSLSYTAFGTGWLDYDNDGWLDLVLANGAVRILEDQAAAGDPFPLRQPNQLFRNSAGSFEEVSALAGASFGVPEVSRGLSLGDVDNDGDVDAVLFNNHGPARLLINERSEGGWLGVRTILPGVSSELLGVRLGVHADGGVARWYRTRTDGSYCSARDPRVTAGLGAGAPARLTASWPWGASSEWRRPPAGHYLNVQPRQRKIAGR
jgi:hypothetical protein